MLNETAVREQLRDVRSALGKIEAEREALRSIELSLTQWLDLHGNTPEQIPLAPVSTNGTAPNKKPAFAKLGSISLKEAIVRALRNREGTTMRTEDILATAISMGAKTNAKDPVGLVEWTIYDIVRKTKAPIHKIAAHEYVYDRTKGTSLE